MLDKLLSRCAQNIHDFRGEGDCTDTPDGVLIHKDNGASVLAVAHLDTVLATVPTAKYRKKDIVVTCPQLDDRLGVWMILDYLPSLGLTYDVLLTDSEERGRSTAKDFVASKAYNWVCEFDRRGLDVVMYQYETANAVKRLKTCGFHTGWGSFSDISSLESLGVQCFNFGVGYHGEHTTRCHAKLSHTIKQAAKFAEFHNKFASVHMAWQPEFITPPRRSSALCTGRYWQGDDYIDYGSSNGRLSDGSEWPGSLLSSAEFSRADQLAIQFGYGGFYEYMRCECVLSEQTAYRELSTLFTDDKYRLA